MREKPEQSSAFINNCFSFMFVFVFQRFNIRTEPKESERYVLLQTLLHKVIDKLFVLNSYSNIRIIKEKKNRNYAMD